MVWVSIVRVDGFVVLENVALKPGSEVQSLRDQVSRALDYRSFKLLSQDGLVLLNGMDIRSLDIGDGAQVTVVKIALPIIFSNDAAFAAVKSDGNVVTWGYARCGGNCEAVREQLATDVQHIYSTSIAFAAVKSDGSVVTWGDAGRGGNCDAVREHLATDVQHIYSTSYAFAAVKLSLIHI